MDQEVIGTSYEHTQSSPATTWIITHNLNRVPIVDIYIDIGGQQERILAPITFNGTTSLAITFSEPQTGFAALI